MSKANEKLQKKVDGPGHCAKCGAFDEALLGGQCPRCLMSIALELTEPGDSSGAGSGGDDAVFPLLPSIARYRIIRQIGEGGMGVVYEAEQEHPSRTVALKVIKPGFATPELLRRFEDEAQALGRLQHPGIAQIYEAGTADTGSGPQPYFAMERIRGTSLTEYASTRHLGTRERLALVAKVAEAVHHAHQRGLIHRDLKPGNILVDESGQPKIVDFGVARVIDGEIQRTVQTDVGRLIGTLAYMSPEQAGADPFEIDIRTDVYALGVLLYELLAGRPMFVKKRLDEAILAIRKEDPARLSSVNRAYRGDIETITAKALEKDKTRRYTSAAELAADIGRYLRDEPIVARPASAGYQLRKFARRNQGMMAGMVMGLSALLIGLGATTWQAARASQASDRSRLSEAEMRIQRDRAANAEADAKTQRNFAVESGALAAAERDRATAAENKMRQDRDRITWQNLGRESVRLSGTRADDDLAALLARQAFLIEKRGPASQSALVENALQQARRPTGWGHSLPLGYQTDIRFIAVTTDGSRLATNGPDGSIALVDLRQRPSPVQFLKGQPGLGPVLFAAFSRDGKRLAAGGGNEGSGFRGSAPLPSPVQLWDLTQPNSPPRLLHGHSGAVSGGMFSPDGKRLATTDSERVLLWDMENLSNEPELLGRVVRNGAPGGLRGPLAVYRSVAFSPDSHRLVTTGSIDIQIWDVQKPRATVLQVILPGLPGSHPNHAVFSPVQDRVASAGNDGVRVWEPGPVGSGLPKILSVLPSPTGQGVTVTATLPGPNSSRSQTLLEGVDAGMVAFSQDGRWLAAGTGNILRVWDLANPSTAPLLLRGHEGGVTALAFLPDGKRLASAGTDKTVRVWELEGKGAPLELVPALPDMIGARRAPPLPDTIPTGGLHPVVTFSAKNERLFAAWGLWASVRAWDRPYTNPSILFPPKGLDFMSQAARIGDLFPLKGLDFMSLAARIAEMSIFSADGSHRAIRAETIRIENLLNPESPPLMVPLPEDFLFPGTATANLNAYQGGPTIALSSDGTKLALAFIARDNVGTIILWDLRSMSARNISPISLAASSRTRFVMAYSKDGTHLALANQLETRVWDLQHLEAHPLVLSARQTREVGALAFSPNGHLLAIGAEDTVVWDLRHPQAEALILRGYPSNPVTAVAFSPDGLRLAVGTSKTQIWDLRNPSAFPVELPFMPVELPFMPQDAQFSLAFSPDSLRLAGGNMVGAVSLWLLGQAAADDLCARVWRNLTMDEWRQYVGESIPYERTCPALPPGPGAQTR